MKPLRTIGTQVEWDKRYTVSYSSAEGPHIFNVGNNVQTADGAFGNVIHRTALTADIQWGRDRNHITTVEQFDSSIYVRR